MVEYSDFYCGDIVILIGFLALAFTTNTSLYEQGAMKGVIYGMQVLGIAF